MPVLPLVASTITVPGLSTPRFSASTIMLSAMRSLIEKPGLNASILAYTVAFDPTTLLRRTSGVLPTSSVASFAIRIGDPLSRCWGVPLEANRHRIHRFSRPNPPFDSLLYDHFFFAGPVSIGRSSRLPHSPQLPS